MGNFEYQTKNTKVKGTFNIYQARNGSIMLVMGNLATKLTYCQINELNINCYLLENFDHDDFIKHYTI